LLDNGLNYAETLTFLYPEFCLIEHNTFDDKSHGTSLN